MYKKIFTKLGENIVRPALRCLLLYAEKSLVRFYFL